MQEFESLLQRASRASSAFEKRVCLEKALVDYQEDLLTGFFEDWVQEDRRRLRALSLSALTQLCLQLEQEGEHEAALEMTARLLQADPLEEHTYRLQMRLCLALGRPQEALGVYATLVQTLELELNSHPSEATRALADQARHSPSLSPLPAAPTPSPIPVSFPRTAPLPSPASAPSPPEYPAPSLPLHLTRFFGREAEIETLQSLLTSGSTRLVTLLGPGGVGKTRLAVEVARRLAADFEGRITFVSLADLGDPAHIPQAIAGALKIAPGSSGDPLEQVLRVLRAGPHLLLLDNLEQLLLETPPPPQPPASMPHTPRELVRTLLAQSPQTTCLLTSRQPLGLAGEQEYRVPALLTPGIPVIGEERERHLTERAVYASVALYEDRVRLVKPDFVVTPTNEPAVALLCQRLEGMPLAIEMAAAWGRTLSPRKTLERLTQRLDLQVSRRSDLPARHQSLRATIEWSYSLLSPELQALFRTLSVFRGGWTLESFEGVSGAEMPALTELIERSLVVAEERAAGEVRYRLMETLREFATEKCRECEETDGVRACHAAYFLDLAEVTVALLQKGQQQQGLMRLEAEHDNLRAALTWCLSTHTGAQMGLRLCSSLAHFWEMHGHLLEGYSWCIAALQAEGAQERNCARAGALCGAGRLAEYQKDPTQERAHYEESRAIAVEIGDQRYLATSLNNLALISHTEGDYTAARSLYMEALALNRTLGRRAAEASNLNNLGLLAYTEGDYPTARKLYQEVLALNRELGNRIGEAGNLNNLGQVCLRQKDLAKAQALFEEALARNRELGNRLWEATNLKNLGDVQLESGEPEAAITLYTEALAWNREMGYQAREAANQNSLGRAHCYRGDYASARACYRESLRLSGETADREELISALEGIVSLFLTEVGLLPPRSLPSGIPIAPPGAQTPIDTVSSKPSLETVAQLWGAAQSLREQFRGPAEPVAPALQSAMVVVETRSGGGALEAALEAGRALSCERIVALAQTHLPAVP